MWNLSSFLFRSLYGPFCGLSRRAAPFALGLGPRLRVCRGGFGFPCGFFLGRMIAPKERSRSSTEIIRTQTAQIIVYLVMITERARPRNGCENLGRHIISKQFFVFSFRNI